MKKIVLFALLAAGCGGGYTPTFAPAPPVTQNAFVSGQYNLMLTSTNGHGTTNIYANFTQAETGVKEAFTGANTLVCPLNDLSQCVGNDAPGISITASGTASGENVSMNISFPRGSETNTVTIVGGATGTGTNFSGTYTDSLGDAGTWTAFSANPLNGTYSGAFNSSSNPLPIGPTILMALAQGVSFHVSGRATLMNFPCISSLTLSGPAIGGAFRLTDAASKARIIAIPTGSNFTFSYNFEPTAPGCAGDFGHGVMANSGGQ